jgi:hypothetical protein
VTPEMNEKLMAVFTKEEISGALRQMLPNKAPGPDWFSAAFLHFFFNTGQFDPRINCTNIAIVPKIKNPI